MTPKNILAAAVASAITATGMWAAEPNTFTTIAQVQAAETTYFAKHGRYFQVIEGNKLPVRQTTPVRTALGKELPSKMQVDTYETSDGSQGYQITYNDGIHTYRIATGVQAEERTSISINPIQVASTTL